MNYNSLLTGLIAIKEVEQSTENVIREIMHDLFFDGDKFLYDEKFEPRSSWDAKPFEIDEFPGWLFSCQESDEAGGHYGYHVVGYAPGKLKPDEKMYQCNSDISIELYWD